MASQKAAFFLTRKGIVDSPRKLHILKIKSKKQPEQDQFAIGLKIDSNSPSAGPLNQLRLQLGWLPGSYSHLKLISALPRRHLDSSIDTLKEIASRQSKFSIKVGAPMSNTRNTGVRNIRFALSSPALSQIYETLRLPFESMVLEMEGKFHSKRRGLGSLPNPHPPFPIPSVMVTGRASGLTPSSAATVFRQLEADYPNGTGHVEALGFLVHFKSGEDQITEALEIPFCGSIDPASQNLTDFKSDELSEDVRSG